LFVLAVLGLIGHCNVVDAFTSGQGLQQSSQVVRQASTRLWGLPMLDKWKVLPNGSVIGTVSNHPSIDDGDVITTSPLANPDGAKGQAFVETASGSKYKLLNPLKPPAPRGLAEASQSLVGGGGFSFAGLKMPTNYYSSNGANGSAEVKKAKSGPEWREAVMKYKLTSSTIGLDEEYLLSGKPTRSTSGKSFIWEAYRAGDEGLPTGDPPVCIKVSTNLEAVSREYENYRKISFLGIARGRFVRCNEFFPVAGYDKRFRNQCALVLEMGARDLKSFLNSRGRLEDKELRDACISAAQCLQALHGVGLVWTDLKTENFVVMPNGEVKGIDLESCMPVGDNPVDYSPEACPPEFAEAFLSGDGPYFLLENSYDIWSLGMMFLELATGRGYFDGKNPAQITKLLRDTEEGVRLDDIECDDRLKDLIRRCLQKNPKKRPNMAQILLHPYFITGPFSFFQNFN
jgi:serine/threonine protein kinase